ncbi:hypothetical protein Y1Q_0018378 [Alligator mississippiensis]|uniref:Myb/SANT-like DNA-binding domain-containing protein n=1 Tax=Alligator mississippiensis TaxID=8496 RepID=A0A151PC78_ALLMI|nr:hypothetical protein Y1Q_0018378 [Alligator mississippiensis]
MPFLWGPNWSQEEIGKLMALWVDLEVQRQFEWDGRLNAHIYEALSGGMGEQGHSQLVQQCRIKVKAFRVQWAAISDRNCQSSCARKTMPFMRQLTRIWHPGTQATAM